MNDDQEREARDGFAIAGWTIFITIAVQVGLVRESGWLSLLALPLVLFGVFFLVAYIADQIKKDR
ncbi:hypothetical protein TSOC111612_23925 [Tsukamurella ocularis]|uniref:hypothetical protein n=1 Tax=Tsukamurella ocularis TaxID=1970234 RepID=UPI0039EF8B82